MVDSNINLMIPCEDFQVGVHRTIEELGIQEFQTDGIIFRNDKQLMVSLGGSMQIIELELDTPYPYYSFKGLPKNPNRTDNTEIKELSVITVDTVRNQNKGLTYESKIDQVIEKEKEQQNNITVQHNVPVTQESNGQTNIESSTEEVKTVPSQDDIAYKEAIEAANFNMDAIEQDFRRQGISDKNINIFTAIKSEVKDAYTDGSDYIYIVTYNIYGIPTTGIIDNGILKFTEGDWQTQSEFIKSYRK